LYEKEELQLAGWIKGDLIGRGSFAMVYYGIHPLTGTLMAVKQVRLPAAPNQRLNISNDCKYDYNNADEDEKEINSTAPLSVNRIEERRRTMVAALQREIDLLRTLRHPNIVGYLGTLCDAEYLSVFLEYVSGGSIASIIRRDGYVSVDRIRHYVPQILDGLAYLHHRSIIHRDIKVLL
jgi:mitogen-activated protein kinase kinase kinase